MANVRIKMPTGDVLCRGDVYPLVGGGPGPTVYPDVTVRRVAPGPAMTLTSPEHYQYGFRIHGGAGTFTLEARDERGAIVGTCDYDGTIQIGLVLDIILSP